MLKKWHQLHIQGIIQKPLVDLQTRHIPNPRRRLRRIPLCIHERIKHGGTPLTADGKVILVNQYRYLCDRESLEFPCGSINEGHTYEQTALLELQEETGYKAGAPLQELGRFNPYNGVTSEICTVYICERYCPA